MKSHNSAMAAHTVPNWDGNRRELCLGDVLVKRFLQPAKNQEAVLAAFQQVGWMTRIDSPFSGRQAKKRLERLRDTVKNLNRQINPLIRFRCDGLGQGILWELRQMDRQQPGAA